jgi:nuclear pore complex protein Nup205
MNTIPEALGQPYRLPGVAPYTAFVIDNVFAKIPNREYSRPSDRWQMNDLCLCHIERSLASFDTKSLVSGLQDESFKSDSVIPFLIHPGFDIAKRLLTNSPLQTSILSYVVDGVEGFEKDLAGEEAFFRSTIVRVPRIILRVLEIQDVFLDVLLPLAADLNSAPIAGNVIPRSHFTRFDQALSFGSQYIPAIAAYVAYPNYPELVLLSVKIITALSGSHSASGLNTLIERSTDSERILKGFMRTIDVESIEDVLQAELQSEQSTGAGAPDTEEDQESHEQAIRLAVLDLLIQNTSPSRRYPNIAHFLLFGGVNIDNQIQDPRALGARQTCIHILLDLLNTGVPRLKEKGAEHDHHHALEVIPLFQSLPGLAERCYRIIYQLCTHSRTSDFTMRYLRTHEDFFVRQLACVPSKVASTLQQPYQVLYNDGSRVTTAIPSLCSFLHLRSYIFDLVALDLHILTNRNQFELQDILQGILDNNRVELVRGNLYAALINYVHLIATPYDDTEVATQKGEDSLTLAHSTTSEDFSLGSNRSLFAASQFKRSRGHSSLDMGSLAVMRNVMDRLIATVSQDAIDGTEVWKTIVFMLLDTLVQLSAAQRQQTVLSALTRHGILTNFVRGIKESDSRLLSILKPDPGIL